MQLQYSTLFSSAPRAISVRNVQKFLRLEFGNSAFIHTEFLIILRFSEQVEQRTIDNVLLAYNVILSKIKDPENLYPDMNLKSVDEVSIYEDLLYSESAAAPEEAIPTPTHFLHFMSPASLSHALIFRLESC